jgi:hypothetical protein
MKNINFLSKCYPVHIDDISAATPKYTYLYTYFEGDCIICISLKRTVFHINAMNRVKFTVICNVCKRR